MHLAKLTAGRALPSLSWRVSTGIWTFLLPYLASNSTRQSFPRPKQVHKPKRAIWDGNTQVIDVEGGERVLAGCVAVAVRQGAQLLQALGDRAGEAVLARHVCVQQDVLWRLPLVAAVGAPQLLHLQPIQSGSSATTSTRCPV